MEILNYIMLGRLVVGAVKHWRYSLFALGVTTVLCYAFGAIALLPALVVSVLVGVLGSMLLRVADEEWEAKGLDSPNDPIADSQSKVSSEERQESTAEGKPWRVIVPRIAIAAIMIGTLVAVLANDWRSGLWAAAIAIAIPAVCAALTIVWGATIIPLVMLTMRLLGNKAQMRASSTESEMGKTQPEAPADPAGS